MAEASTRGWLAALDTLLALKPQHVIPGHFAPSRAADLIRFRSYLQAQWDHAKAALIKGRLGGAGGGAGAIPRVRQVPAVPAVCSDVRR